MWREMNFIGRVIPVLIGMALAITMTFAGLATRSSRQVLAPVHLIDRTIGRVLR